MAPQASEFSPGGHNPAVLTAVRPLIHHSSAKTINLRAMSNRLYRTPGPAGEGQSRRGRRVLTPPRS